MQRNYTQIVTQGEDRIEEPESSNKATFKIQILLFVKLYIPHTPFSVSSGVDLGGCGTGRFQSFFLFHHWYFQSQIFYSDQVVFLKCQHHNDLKPFTRIKLFIRIPGVLTLWVRLFAQKKIKGGCDMKTNSLDAKDGIRGSGMVREIPF